MHNTFCQPNARFLSYVNGDWVKITLKPEQQLTWRWYCRTEEGYAAGGSTWTHEGDHVREEQASDGRDCDGRHGDSREDICPLALLRARPIYHRTWNEERSHWYEQPTGEYKPDWRQEKSGPVYDQYAQLAGY
jgi:hypothetical protein